MFDVIIQSQLINRDGLRVAVTSETLLIDSHFPQVWHTRWNVAILPASLLKAPNM